MKVAGYCRVSTEKEDQAGSFASQQRFFRDYIEHHPGWELYEIYADEGITGTSRKKRVQFNRMMHDAGEHKFRLILTKEISRFSRNVLDTIACTRELKALGIGVVFLSDGFCSLDPDAELRLSILGSIAQEESRRTSSRVKWGQTRRMEQGVVFGTSLLGYDVESGVLSVNPEGARIVKEIFYKYAVEEKGTTVIARELREAGYKTRTGNPVWSNSHILKILKNEKYAGDLVQKKSITPDYLTHQKKYNHGEERQIILRDHHEPIVSRELWDLAQEKIRERHRSKNTSEATSGQYIFSGRILCGECGARFVSRQKLRRDGTSCRCWSCGTAAREGRRKTDLYGNVLGCDIGKQLRDDLAVDILKDVLGRLDLDREGLIENLTGIVTEVKRKERGALPPETLHRQIRTLREKQTAAIDRYVSGDITKEEFRQVSLRYEQELEALRSRLSPRDRPVSGTLREAIGALLTWEKPPEACLKALPEYMRVHKDGTVELKLRQLPALWKYRLYQKSPGEAVREPGCHKESAVPISVSSPFSSSKGME